MSTSAPLALPRRSFLGLTLFSPLFVPALLAEREPAVSPPPRAPAPWQQGPEALERWRRATRRPVWESADLLQARLVQAIATGDGVEFDYDGGNEPGQRRRVSPGLLFTVDGYPGTYLAGYCHERQAERTFLVDRLRLR